MGYMQPKLVIFYNQSWLPVVEFEYKPSHKIFNLQIILSTIGAGLKGAMQLCDILANEESNLSPMPQDKAQN